MYKIHTHTHSYLTKTICNNTYCNIKRLVHFAWLLHNAIRYLCASPLFSEAAMCCLAWRALRGYLKEGGTSSVIQELSLICGQLWTSYLIGCLSWISQSIIHLADRIRFVWQPSGSVLSTLSKAVYQSVTGQWRSGFKPNWPVKINSLVTVPSSAYLFVKEQSRDRFNKALWGRHFALFLVLWLFHWLFLWLIPSIKCNFGST